jgi:cytoskeletal protein RodZ
MSDDTPTQKFPSASDEVKEDLQEEKQKSKGLLIGLIAAGALLLVAIVVLVFFLGRATGQPQAGDTQTSTPSASDGPTPGASETPGALPTPTAVPTEEPVDDGDDAAPPPPPPPTGAAFTTFSPKSQVRCEFSAPGFDPPTPIVEISWKTVRADSAWIVQGTSDAADSGFMQIPLNGNQSDFQYELQFPCFQANATFTITLVGSDGHHVSKSWTIKNTGDKT